MSTSVRLGRLGVWALVDALPSSATAALAREAESLGYSALWTGEASGRDILVHSAWLLSQTRTLLVASGIASIYARDAQAMSAARAQLAEQSGGRFVLGIGVSHPRLVTKLHGQAYGAPVPTMRNYLAAMGRAPYRAPLPAAPAPVVLAALGPKMLALARDAADGAHPYNTTVEQTAEARQILGAGKLLCVEQKVLLETDAARARAIGRANLRGYLAVPNYLNSWRRAGFSDADFANDLSDRLVDALVAWGDEEAIFRRLQAQWAAGADHVCIQTLQPDTARSTMDGPHLETLRRLAPLAKR